VSAASIGPHNSLEDTTVATSFPPYSFANANAERPGAVLSPKRSPQRCQGRGAWFRYLKARIAAMRLRLCQNSGRRETKRHVLDTFAAIVSGSELPPGRSALAFAKEYGGKEVATVVSSKLLCGPIEAALTNAMLAHSDETDDSHPGSQSHPGCAVIPAALAVGEQFGISGSHFLRAVSLGYDVGTRFTIIVGERYESETHRSTHSIAPLFGARLLPVAQQVFRPDRCDCYLATPRNSVLG